MNLAAGAALAQVVITNKPSSVRAMTFYNFTVSVNGARVTGGITWSVDGVAGGNSTLGVFSSFRYNAPVLPPSPDTVTIKAALTADPTQFDTATVVIANPYPDLASVSPWPLAAGTYTITVNGSGFINGAVIYMNRAPLATTYLSPTRLTATVALKTAPKNDTAFFVMNPDPGAMSSAVVLVPPLTRSGRSVVSDSAARRFLEQGAFGPDPYSVSRVTYLGFDRWIDEQVTEPVSAYLDPGLLPLSNGPVQARFFTNAVHGRDQLRQRVALALHKIMVVSGLEINTPEKLVPYLNTLSNAAFSNFRTILRKVTLNPAMGDYLDMRNSVKADPAKGTLPNENYGREVMQLFSIGLYQLNPDGTEIADSQGNPVPTYTQATIGEMARALTGWTYPTMVGAVPRQFNPPNYNGDMVAWEPSHDTGSKVLLDGQTLPAGQTAEQDLDGTLDILFNHHNAGPFIGKQLIQQLVKSDPSPAYVARVAAAFADNGAGVRGDMIAVIKAVLLDPEARAGDDAVAPAAGDGHLKEPVLFFAQTLRGLGAQVNDYNNLASRGNALGQNIFYPSSVFSYFSPAYVIPESGGLPGPEFQIDTRTAAVERANQINTLVYGNYGAGVAVDFSPWTTLAANPSALADQLGAAFLYGQMPSIYRNELIGAISGTTGTNLQKAQAGLYVTLTSGYYSVSK